MKKIKTGYEQISEIELKDIKTISELVVILRRHKIEYEKLDGFDKYVQKMRDASK